MIFFFHPALNPWIVCCVYNFSFVNLTIGVIALWAGEWVPTDIPSHQSIAPNLIRIGREKKNGKM